MLSSLKIDRVYYPFYEVIKLVLIPGEAFYWFDGLYSKVHFEVSSWDQSTSLQDGLNISRFWMANYQLDGLWHESSLYERFGLSEIRHFCIIFCFVIAIYGCTPRHGNWLRNLFSVGKIIVLYSHVVCRSSHLEMFCEKGVLKNFAKFTGKHLCQGLFFNKGAGHRP